MSINRFHYFADTRPVENLAELTPVRNDLFVLPTRGKMVIVADTNEDTTEFAFSLSDGAESNNNKGN